MQKRERGSFNKKMSSPASGLLSGGQGVVSDPDQVSGGETWQEERQAEKV